MTITVRAAGPAVDLDIAPWLPPGHATLRTQVRQEGRARDAGRSTSGAVERTTVRVRTGTAPVSVDFSWTGGLSPVAPVLDLAPGQVSDGLRITGFAWHGSDGAWQLDVAGTPGRTYELELRGVPVRCEGAAAEVLAYRDHTTRLRVRMPDSDAAAASLRVRLAPASR